MDNRIVTSVEEMNAVAAEVASELHVGQILLLYGELGAGKTTFVQGLAKALGIKELVTSPTFTIVGEYAVTSHPTIQTLVHVDLYRLDETTALNDPAVRDMLDRAQDPGRLTVIEWADRLGENALKKAQSISFQHGQTSSERIIETIFA